MSKQPLTREILEILRLLSSKENITQRDLSMHLGISLGKTNYLLKELVNAGLLEVKNIPKDRSRIHKTIYHLTKEGMEERIRLTYCFLKKKEGEYNNIMKEWKQLNEEKLTLLMEDR